MSSLSRKGEEKTWEGRSDGGSGRRGREALPAAPSAPSTATVSGGALGKRAGKAPSTAIAPNSTVATTSSSSTKGRRKGTRVQASRQRPTEAALQRVPSAALPPSSTSLALNYEVARAEDEHGDIMTTERINLAFNALTKLIPHTGHLKRSFQVVLEELYEAVYSPELTTVDTEASTGASSTQRAARAQATPEGSLSSGVQRILYATLCQQLRQERLSVEEEVQRTVQARERKHASERRDLLNSRAEVEELKARRKELEETLSSEEARLGDRELKYIATEKQLREEVHTLKAHTQELEHEITRLRAEVSSLEKEMGELQWYKDAFDTVQDKLATAATTLTGSAPRGVLKCNHGAVWSYIGSGASALQEEQMAFRSRLVRDMEAANQSTLRSMSSIFFLPPPTSSQTASSKPTSTLTSTSAAPDRHSCSFVSARAFQWNPPQADHEASLQMLKTVTRELALTSADGIKAREKVQQFSERDPEKFQVKDQFYAQLGNPPLPTAARAPSLRINEHPKHITPEEHERLWRHFDTRRQFAAPPPELLPLETMYAYATDVFATALDRDAAAAGGARWSEDDVATMQDLVYAVFDRWFPHADAATIALRDFFYSLEHHSEDDAVLRVLLRSLAGRTDTAAIAHAALVHTLIHTLRLSTTQHLEWLMQELFPLSNVPVEKLKLSYAAFADGAPSSDALSQFYLQETVARDWNPGAVQIGRVAERVIGASGLSAKPLSVLKCERISHDLCPYVPDQVVLLFFERSAKTLRAGTEVPYAACTWIIMHARLLVEAEMLRLNIQDRMDGLSEQRVLVNKRSRHTQLQAEMGATVTSKSSS